MRKEKKITILGKEYSSIAEAAKLNNVSEKNLRYRLSRWGNNDRRLFEPVKSSEVILVGKTYPSLSEAARTAGIPIYILRKNIKRFGKNDPRILKRNPRKPPIFVDGEEYKSSLKVAEAFNVNPDLVVRRLKESEKQGKGRNLTKDDLKFKLKTGFEYRGKKYKSVEAFLRIYPPAKRANISRSAFLKRLKKFGDNEKILFSTTEDFEEKFANRGKKIVYQGKEYPSFISFCKAANLSRDSMRARVKKVGWTSPDLLLSVDDWLKKYRKQRIDHQITYLGKTYASIEDLARKHGISASTLEKRLKKYGWNYPDLLKPARYKAPNSQNPRLRKKYKVNFKKLSEQSGLSIWLLTQRVKDFGEDCEDITASPHDFCLNHQHKEKNGNEIKYKGVIYNNLSELSAQTKLPITKLRQRIKTYGKVPDIGDPDKEFKLNHSSHKVIWQGHTFTSIRAMARYYGISSKTLTDRIKILGIDSPDLLLSNEEYKRKYRYNQHIKYNGKEYKSVAHIARKYKLPEYIVSSRLKAGVSLDTSTDELRKNNKKELYKQSNLLTLEQVAQETGLTLSYVSSLASDNVKHYMPFDLNKYKVIIKKNIVGFKREAVNDLKKYFGNLPKDLIILPLTNNKYLIDPKTLEVYSNTMKNGGIYKKHLVKNKLGADYYSLFILEEYKRKHSSGSKYTLEELRSILDYPDITYKDIVTFEQIRNTYSKEHYILNKLRYHKFKVWRRHDNNGKLVKGYLKRDVAKYVKEQNKPAVVLEGIAYPRWKDAAKAYNCSVATLHQRIKKYGPNDSLGLRDQIEFLGKIYSSKKEIAEHYHIPYSIFRRREVMGCKPEELVLSKEAFEALMTKKNQSVLSKNKTKNKAFETKLVTKKTTIISKPITLNGVKYSGGIREAAQAHYLDPYIVLNRIRKHGTDYDRLFDKVMTKNRGPIKLQGKYYPGGFPQAAKEHNMNYKLLYGRYRKYGPNDKRLFIPINESRYKNIEVLGHQFKNLSELSQTYGISTKVLEKRLHEYDHDDIRVIDNYIDYKLSNFKQYDNPELSKPIEIAGKKYNSTIDFCKRIGISYQTFLNRKKAVGLNDKRMSSEPINKPVLCILNYIFFSWNQAARFFNVNTKRLKNLIRAGYRDKELLSMIKNKTKIPVSRQNKKSTTYQIKILGKEYKSMTEFAQLHNMEPSTLKARIYRYGADNPKILADNLKNNVEVTIRGVTYSSVEAAAKALGINAAVLRNRLKAGKKGDNLVDYINNNKVVLCGREYKSIAEAARQHGLVPATLYVRIDKYGKNDPIIFKRPKRIQRKINKKIWKVTILGKEYESISECAKKHGISDGTLKSRIKAHGNDWPYLFDKPKWTHK